MSLATKFREWVTSLHAHHDIQAVETFVEELAALESRVAIVEQLVKSVVPGLAAVPQLPVLDPAAVEDQAPAPDPTNHPVSGLPLQDPSSTRRL